MILLLQSGRLRVPLNFGFAVEGDRIEWEAQPEQQRAITVTSTNSDEVILAILHR